MSKNRPELDKNMDRKTFMNFYYLKEELVKFCKENSLQTTGGKIELKKRIADFLDSGEIVYMKNNTKKTNNISKITLDTLIEENIVCSEKHRSFFKEQIGKTFSFNVLFQKWLKNNAGKSYADSIQAYDDILKEKKNTKSSIDKQFEYNTYIRDFFENNKGKTLQDAIKCWNYKKSIQGHNRYEESDLIAIK